MFCWLLTAKEVRESQTATPLPPALYWPLLNPINSSALQEVLGRRPVMQPEILMTKSFPQGGRRRGENDRRFDKLI